MRTEPNRSPWPSGPGKTYLRVMRSLPFLPILLLVLGAALSGGNSWAGPDETEATDESTDSPAAAKKDAPKAKDPEAKEAAKKPTAEEKRTQLERKREQVMAEIVALEEGWSDLEKEDREPSEEALSERLTQLNTRLDELDREIAALESKK